MKSSRRMLALLAIAGLGASSLLPGCARQRTAAPVFTATATANMKPELERAEARRDAIQRAEVLARDQLMNQAAQMRVADGQTSGSQTLESLAVADPFVRAVLQDTVRAAQITDRTISDEGLVTVTVSMRRTPIDKMLAGYALPPIGK